MMAVKSSDLPPILREFGLAPINSESPTSDIPVPKRVARLLREQQRQRELFEKKRAALRHPVEASEQERSSETIPFSEAKPSAAKALPASYRIRPFASHRFINAVAASAIISISTLLLIVAVQHQREAARRIQCVNNLKQLALSTLNYSMTYNVFPMGVNYQPWDDPAHGCSTSFSWLVAVSQDFPSKTAYNAMNFSVNMYSPQNTTVSGIGLSELWCPGDPVISGMSHTYPAGSVTATPLPMRYTSYAANAGTFFQSYGVTAASADAAAMCRFGAAPPLTYSNGVIYALSTVRIPEIADGMGNTLLFSERAHGQLSPQDRTSWDWWTSGYYGDTVFTTFYPLNPAGKIPNFCCLDGGSPAYIASASSYHPAGANFAFCDGSVHFLKDTIDSWKIQSTGGTATGPAYGVFAGNGYPEGVTRDSATKAFNFPLQKVQPGIYQRLSTRNGGDVVSTDDY